MRVEEKGGVGEGVRTAEGGGGGYFKSPFVNTEKRKTPIQEK